MESLGCALSKKCSIGSTELYLNEELSCLPNIKMKVSERLFAWFFDHTVHTFIGAACVVILRTRMTRAEDTFFAHQIKQIPARALLCPQEFVKNLEGREEGWGPSMKDAQRKEGLCWMDYQI